MSEETKQCPYCAETIKAAANLCRYCRRDLTPSVQHQSFRLTAEKPVNKASGSNVFTALLIMLILGGGGFFYLPNVFKGVSGPIPVAQGVVDKAQFDQVREGMSYSSVSGIVGSPGAETSSTHTEGISGVMPPINTKTYLWQNPDGSNMQVIFQNDKMTIKAQSGLN